MNSTAAPGVIVSAFRWWHIPAALTLEQTLFAPDCWSAELFWSELAQRGLRHYLVATVDASVVGYGGLAAYGEEAYVQTLGVSPHHQHRGIGGALLDALLEEAERRRVRTVGLEVRTDNTAAQRLYARRGFEVVGTRRGYYQPSGADAHVMLRPQGEAVHR